MPYASSCCTACFCVLSSGLGFGGSSALLLQSVAVAAGNLAQTRRHDPKHQNLIHNYCVTFYSAYVHAHLPPYAPGMAGGAEPKPAGT